MTEQTKQSLKECIEYLDSDGWDKEGALRGLEDWFLQSVIEDFGMGFGTSLNMLENADPRQATE